MKKCDCKKMSCKKGCTQNHTHKGFFCEVCEPEAVKQMQKEIVDYGKISHSHCWTSKRPPCGQKIKHLECCLCEELNPKVKSLEAAAFRKGQEEYKQFVLNILDGVDKADKEISKEVGYKVGGTKAIRLALQSRLIK